MARTIAFQNVRAFDGSSVLPQGTVIVLGDTCGGYVGYPFHKSVLMMNFITLFSTCQQDGQGFPPCSLPSRFRTDIPHSHHRVRQHGAELCGQSAGHEPGFAPDHGALRRGKRQPCAPGHRGGRTSLGRASRNGSRAIPRRRVGGFSSFNTHQDCRH